MLVMTRTVRIYAEQFSPRDKKLLYALYWEYTSSKSRFRLTLIRRI